MNQVFDVYTHSTKGQWGFSAVGAEVWTAEIKPEKALKLERVEAIKLGALLTKRVRMGYVRMTRAKYLHQTLSDDGEVFGEFNEVHPDVCAASGESLVLMVPKPFGDTALELITVWETTLQAVSGVSEQASQWLKRQERAQQYLTAFDNHPALALVLADWALRNRQIVLSQKGVVPQRAPQEDPMAWKQFLSNWFTEERVQNALEQLQWSLRDAMLRPVVAPMTNNNADQANSWIAEAGLAAF